MHYVEQLAQHLPPPLKQQQGLPASTEPAASLCSAALTLLPQQMAAEITPLATTSCHTHTKDPKFLQEVESEYSTGGWESDWAEVEPANPLKE